MPALEPQLGAKRVLLTPAAGVSRLRLHHSRQATSI
jgi:hypothetical protein